MARHFAGGDELYRLLISRTWTRDGQTTTTESSQGPYPELSMVRGQRTRRLNDNARYGSAGMTETIFIQKATTVWETVE